MSPKRRQTRRTQRSAPARGGSSGGRADAQRRPLPQGQSFYTPGSSGVRRSVERHSGAALVFMHQLPRWALPVVTIGLMLVGLAGPLWVGLPALGVLILLLSWLGFLSWPSLETQARVLRVLVVVVLVAAGAVRLLV